ncbi:MAG: hypothetical protein ACRDGL_06310, partial [Candidatus Limnocylindrales bacterium]
MARALGVSIDQVLPTEDGAVAVRLNGGSLTLALASRDPGAPGSWTTRSIAVGSAEDNGATSIDAIGCDD